VFRDISGCQAGTGFEQRHQIVQQRRDLTRFEQYWLHEQRRWRTGNQRSIGFDQTLDFIAGNQRGLCAQHRSLGIKREWQLHRPSFAVLRPSMSHAEQLKTVRIVFDGHYPNRSAVSREKIKICHRKFEIRKKVAGGARKAGIRRPLWSDRGGS
jgi:hypothetical protein